MIEKISHEATNYDCAGQSERQLGCQRGLPGIPDDLLRAGRRRIGLVWLLVHEVPSIAFLFLKQEFARPVRRFHHRLDQCHAQLPLLQLEDAVDRAAGRSGHRIFQ